MNQRSRILCGQGAGAGTGIFPEIQGRRCCLEKLPIQAPSENRRIPPASVL